MVTTDPRTDDRRKSSEALIRIIDIVLYGLWVVAGIFAGFFTPATVRGALEGNEWLIVLWSALLIVGGLAGFIGRISRRWWIETPGIFPAMAGGAIYMVVLASVAFTNTTTLVAISFLAISIASTYRRYRELRIFTDDGRAQPTSIAERIQAILRRRTTDAVRRQRD